MSWDDVHDTRRTFRALLEAQCDPGARTPLLTGSTVDDSWHAVLTTLLDPGVSVAMLADDVRRHLVRLAVEVTDPTRADFVLARSGDDLGRACRGTAREPETGATVLLAAGASSAWELTGPGLVGTVRRSLPIDADTMRTRNTACAEPPLGIDLIVIDAGAVWALPRSTRVSEAV